MKCPDCGRKMLLVTGETTKNTWYCGYCEDVWKSISWEEFEQDIKDTAQKIKNSET